MPNNNLKFYKINTLLPKYNTIYNGLFVMDSTNSLYVGTSNGWKKLDNDDLSNYYTKSEIDNMLTNNVYYTVFNPNSDTLD